MHGDQGEGDGRRVGQHVARVGEERQAAGEEAAGHFGQHVADDQHERGSQVAPARPSHLVGMVVPTGIVRVAAVIGPGVMAAVLTLSIGADAPVVLAVVVRAHGMAAVCPARISGRVGVTVNGVLRPAAAAAPAPLPPRPRRRPGAATARTPATGSPRW